MHEHEILYIKEGGYDLENWTKVTKTESTRSALPTVYLCKFGQNPFIGSKDNARKRSYADANADTDRIRTKNNMSPLLRLGGHKNNQTVFLGDLIFN